MRIILFLLSALMLQSCKTNNNKETKLISDVAILVDSIRFSEKIDTVYKINSTEISQISREFYSYTYYPEKPIKKSDNVYDKKELELKECFSKEFNKMVYFLQITNGFNSSTVMIKSRKGLLKFFENAGILFSNPEKSFLFSIGEEENYPDLIIGKMEHSIEKKGNYINLSAKSSIDNKYYYIDIDKNELDSMVACFEKVQNEKKSKQ